MTIDIRNSFLEISSLSSSSIDEVYTGHFDFAMGASSWDERSIAMTNARNFTSDFGLLFYFLKKDSKGVSERHETILGVFFERYCKRHSVHEVEATHLRANWEVVRSALLKAYHETHRPLSVFVDLSTIPRHLSLGLLGFGLEHGLIESLTYGYSEGEYPNDDKDSVSQELFTEGGWEAVAIPGFIGEWEPCRARHYIVALGFEGVKTQQLVSRSEPDKVSVLFPDPPVKEGYDEITFENNRLLIERFAIPKERIVRAHATDIVAALNRLQDAELENLESENCLYVCCGTKPHSLALAIRAVLVGEPAVLYVVPESHRVSYTKPNGVFWNYTIRDHSAI